MFYCETCRKRNGWPQSIRRSHGACEVCGRQGDCNDCPSSALPAPPAPRTK